MGPSRNSLSTQNTPAGQGLQDLGHPLSGISRVSRACERCRLRKVRCDGHEPCARCREQESNCSYRPGKSRNRPRRPKIQARRPPVQSPTRQSPAIDNPSTTPVPESLSQGVTSPSGYWRVGIQTGIGVSNSETGAFQFYGPSSQYAFLQRVYDRLHPGFEANQFDSAGSVPTGLRAWGLETFIFSSPPHHVPQPRVESFLPRNLGELFIRSYFKLVHPQMPILVYADVMAQWAQSWKPPASKNNPVRAREILHMVLAIGALVAPPSGSEALALSNSWAEYFAQSVDIPLSVMTEPTLQLVHTLLLKALYAQQVMRPNETYLHLGYAVRAALALGINRAPVVNGYGSNMHHLKMTIWLTFAFERVTALLVGRPSCLRDEQIDAPYPQDQPPPPAVGDLSPQLAIDRSAFVRVLADIGKLADGILTRIYPLGTLSAAEQYLVESNMQELDARLLAIAEQLPDYLNFLDEDSSVGDGWQEIQRLHLGLLYHTLRMLIHRPVVVFTTFFDSNREAQQHARGVIQLQESIDISISSARNIIRFAQESLGTRQPDARSDGSLASYLVAACITLLYQVLDPATAIAYAKETFAVVEQAVQCLDNMNHLGPRTGKILSTEILRIAKGVFCSSTREDPLDLSLINEFPWLDVSPSTEMDLTGPLPDPTLGGTSITQHLRAWPFQLDLTAAEPATIDPTTNPPTADPSFVNSNLDLNQSRYSAAAHLVPDTLASCFI
ncbi:uncharacterized protein BO66DRAFT_473377 [Aspergillus aculeatinus CBS 121060]|uniref:Uncharacterized protein n=1 Tax=Aspergillus aculeatinus CBS 121060 TaxID=1448322 RepID=A0ACD1H296_9EURO|nr:hypothetical protein BO66DRAFT_473377 [Aspergillus aculeatinus CBS 121060]RAH67550.1 hypothetical protein BO66DRAFT_473377 [Aspergillus aculeatinus CBS 121060]